MANVPGNGSKDYGWIYRFKANPGKPESGIVPLIPVLAPGTALGSRPRVALSSAQALSVYHESMAPDNSRLSHILANRGEQILPDARAETWIGNQSGRPEIDCRKTWRVISERCMLLSIITFEKGALSATGSR